MVKGKLILFFLGVVSFSSAQIIDSPVLFWGIRKKTLKGAITVSLAKQRLGNCPVSGFEFGQRVYLAGGSYWRIVGPELIEASKVNA